MHTGLYSNWSGFRGIIKKSCVLAFETSLRKLLQIMHEDSQSIKTMLVCNVFPANFLDDCVRNFLHRMYTLITLFHERYSLQKIYK